jgi:hypothetical protein
MPLPLVEGWLIDFRTARTIFVSGNNQWISHCVGLCEEGRLHFCHCERELFKDMPILKATFLDNQNCTWEPDEDVFQRCVPIGASPAGQNRLMGNEAAVFLTAIAASRNFGVISDHRSPVFTTVYDLCNTYGVPVLSAAEYFELALP